MMDNIKLQKTIAIIGAGNMGKAILTGLLANKIISVEQVIVIDKQHMHLQVNQFQVAVQTELEKTAAVDIVILAVKPQDMKDVLEQMHITQQLILSIAAGVSIKTIESIIGKGKKIVRAMPNLNAKVGRSISVWSTNHKVAADDKKDIDLILSAIGNSMYITNEKMMNAVTAISGSGPAYFFYVCECLVQSAIALGFSEEEAKILVNETFIGSASLAASSQDAIEVLRQQVTSKGGTTEAAISSFINDAVDQIILRAVLSAERRAEELNT